MCVYSLTKRNELRTKLLEIAEIPNDVNLKKYFEAKVMYNKQKKMVLYKQMNGLICKRNIYFKFSWNYYSYKTKLYYAKKL